MAKVAILKLDGKSKKEKADLPDDIFGVTAKPVVLANAARYYMNRKRKGNAKTKSRKEVRGGGRKPFKQKGTGNARQGSIRAPHMEGGGNSIRPSNCRASIRMTYRLRRLALRAALSDKVRDGNLAVLDAIKLEKPSTKDFADFTYEAGFNGRVLFVLDSDSKMTYSSIRNLDDVDGKRASSINAYDVLRAGAVVLSDKAAEILTGRLKEK